MTGERHRDAWRALLSTQLLEDRQSIPIRQRQIEEHQIRSVRARDSDRIRHGGRNGNSPSCLLEQDAERATHQIVVLDDEHVRDVLSLPSRGS